MRFTAAIALGAAATVTAQSATSSAWAPDSTQLSCLKNCGDDVNCKAHCITVPSPNEDQANKTTECAAKCPQGDGSPAATENYSKCVQDCISKYYYTKADGTPESGSGGSDSGSGDSDSNSGGSNSGNAGAGQSASGTATGTGASPSQTSGSDAGSSGGSSGSGSGDNSSSASSTGNGSGASSSGASATNSATNTEDGSGSSKTGASNTPSPTNNGAGSLAGASAAVFGIVAALFAL